MSPIAHIPSNLYFLGIGGMGMSSLADFCLQQGHNVAGYDRAHSQQTQRLTKNGAIIHYEEDITAFPKWMEENPAETLVIYSPAIAKTSPLWQYFTDNGCLMQSRAAVLGQICNQKPLIAVGGTHGKTTTSGLIVHILYQSGIPMVGFVGGILNKYNTNLIQNSSMDQAQWVVVEADEFNRSLLQLFPKYGIITALDFDHPETYADDQAFKATFISWIGQISTRLWIQTDAAQRLLEEYETLGSIPWQSYGIEQGEIQAKDINHDPNKGAFDYHHHDQYASKLPLPLPGMHNVENSLAAVAICKQIGLSWEEIKQGLATFPGIQRRFAQHFTHERCIYIDDYAHHPQEIAAFIHGVQKRYPGWPILALFEPHLFSRTASLCGPFGQSLSGLEEVWLLPIYPAREPPIPGVTSHLIIEVIDGQHKQLMETSEVIPGLKGYLEKVTTPQLVVTMGAGPIGELAFPIVELLDQLYR